MKGLKVAASAAGLLSLVPVLLVVAVVRWGTNESKDPVKVPVVIDDSEGAGEADGSRPLPTFGRDADPIPDGIGQEEIRCSALPSLPLSPVETELHSTVELSARGGSIRHGQYTLRRVIRPDGTAAREGDSGYEMAFILRENGIGALTRKLGLRKRTSKITWRAKESTFTYSTVCPDTMEQQTFGYSVAEDGSLLLIVRDPPTLLEFATES